jgi:spermidine synthase
VLLTKAGNQPVANVFLGVATVCCFLLRDRAVAFGGMIAVVAVSALMIGQGTQLLETDRSFFGVSRVTRVDVAGIGPVRLMEHGTTLHGAQAESGPYRCQGLAYYGPLTPISQAFDKVLARGPGRRIGVIGMGAGAVATRTRPGDTMRYFEIDPVVSRLANDPGKFSFIHGCAKGQVDYVMGDARLTVARQLKGAMDMLLVDAFSSDSVPAHLLTVEAMRIYLDRVKPDGVVVMHLSNRNLELKGPVAATAKAAGAYALEQQYAPLPGALPMINAPEEVVIVARSPAALAQFARDPRWKPANPRAAKAWTDDYTNILGALIGRIREPSGGPAR